VVSEPKEDLAGYRTPFQEKVMQSQFSTSSLEGFPKGRPDEDDFGSDLSADDDEAPGNGSDADEDEEMELPVDPDEGMPAIPDDERVIDVPS
jgi:hypothetical protein